MASILYKWFLLLLLIPSETGHSGTHPYFLSVTEIEHNAKDKTLEISCKLFTDDFEKTLQQNYKTAVDLINPKDKTATNKLITDYVQKHLSINVDGKNVAMIFIGYEKEEEGILSYWQVNNIAAVKKISITDNLLYDYKKEQMGIIHVTVGGTRKSSRLSNPDDKVVVEF
ncbi:MAG: DUF6702 family protein [Ferruginibacter sp.]